MRESKYTEEALADGVGTSNGWGYDIFEGGYIRPLEILLDKDRAQKLTEAIELLEAWAKELDDDGVLNDL